MLASLLYVYAQFLSCDQLFATPWTIACQAPLSMEFSRQEYWSRLPFPTPGYPPNPGIEPESLMSPALAGGFVAWHVESISFLQTPENNKRTLALFKGKNLIFILTLTFQKCLGHCPSLPLPCFFFFPSSSSSVSLPLVLILSLSLSCSLCVSFISLIAVYWAGDSILNPRC